MKTSLLLIGAALSLLSGCASGPAPEIGLPTGVTYYISPLNGDGFQDYLELAVDLEIAESRGLAGYRVTVSDEQGIVVRTEEELYPRRSFRERIGAFFRRRSQEGRELPQQIVWDGRSQKGAFVPDGTYSLLLEAWDNKKDISAAEPVTVVVDNTPPRIRLDVPYRVFSPNGDGNKDTLALGHTASTEELWEAFLTRPDGALIASHSWPATPPERFVWDGRNERGETVPDGRYSYRITAKDRAGNVGEAVLDGIGINTQPTPVSLTMSRSAFSPNGDGRADSVAITPIFPLPGLEGWTLQIVDAEGRWIRQVAGIDPLIFDWDGTDQYGNPAPDGGYTLVFTATYENGNSPRAEQGPVLLDTRSPYVVAVADTPVFSPDGDQLKDVVTFSHRNATLDGAWTGEIRLTSGRVVHTERWSRLPEEYSWNGRDGAGKVVMDGRYEYHLYGTDEADNRYACPPVAIGVDNRRTTLAIELSGAAFSPNGDGVKESILFRPIMSVPDGIESWALEITDGEDRTVRRLAGTPEEQPAWSGITDAGRRAPDGSYRGELEVTYTKGNRPRALSQQFVIDTVAPSVQLGAPYTLFSPDGDGRRDTITFEPASATVEDAWIGEVTAEDGTVVAASRWSGVPRTFVWGGTGPGGATVGDGSYRYRLQAVDGAGNRGSAELRGVRVDTRARPVGVRATEGAFSPNGDGVKERLRFIPEAQIAEGVEAWELHVEDGTGRRVRSFSGEALPPQVEWDGRGREGRAVADGSYRGVLEVRYSQGAVSTARSETVLLDTVSPRARLVAEYLLFSPEGDGRRDTVMIGHADISRESRWYGEILNAAGGTVRRAEWVGTPPGMTWDGKNDSGAPVSDATYRYRLTATDEAGNRGLFELPGIRLDRRATPVSVIVGSGGFSPDGNTVQDSLSLEIGVGLSDGITSWELSAVTDREAFPIGRGRRAAPPTSFNWDGTVLGGGTAPEGSYHVLLRLDYEKGNLAEGRTAPFVLDVSPPSLSIDVSPLPFSPDDDGINDTLGLAARASDLSGITGWEIVINDPMGRRFYSVSGTGLPPVSPIRWDGRSITGELVQAAWDYSILFVATDEWGNTGRAERPLPVDILVIRDGDRLRIQISSIYFAPFTAEFQPGKEAENRRTLQRLAEILKRYPEHNIGIEGHAVRIYWYDEALGEYEERETLKPLSELRATVIKSALIDLGIPARRMQTAGFGGMVPVVLHSDLENRWKNRRVEFILRR